MPNDQQMKLKSDKYQAISIQKKRSNKKQDKIIIGPIVLAILLFVIVGSALFQIFNAGSGTSGDVLI